MKRGQNRIVVPCENGLPITNPKTRVPIFKGPKCCKKQSKNGPTKNRRPKLHFWIAHLWLHFTFKNRTEKFSPIFEKSAVKNRIEKMRGFIFSPIFEKSD